MTYQNYLDNYKNVNFSTANFDKEIINVFKEGHSMITELAENGMLEDTDFKQDVKEHYDMFTQMLKKIGSSTSKKKPTKKAPVKKTTTRRKSTSKKTTTRRKTPAKKTTTRRNLPSLVKNAKKVTTKRSSPMESELGLALIRRFLNMIGKKKTRNSVQLLLNRINKAAVNKEIRLKSQYAEPLKFVGESLANALNTSYATFKFKLEKQGAELLEPYMNDKEATSIRLLRQFYNAQNKKFTERYEKLIENLKKVDKDDAFYVDVKAAIKTLQTARQNRKVIKATRATLKGLDGICKKKSSLNGLDGAGLHPAIAGAVGGAASGIVGGAVYRALSGQDIIDSTYESIPLPSKYRGIGLDDIPYNASILMYAYSGYGKSTLALEFAQEFSAFGRTAYVSYEEFTSDGRATGGLRNRLKRMKDNIGISKNVDYFSSMEAFDINDYQFIFIDSIDDADMTIKDWEELRAMYPTKFFVLIAQVTKNGMFRGSNRWAHKVDVVFEFPKIGVAVGRKRYGTGTYDFFNPKYA
ncbi:hypothetical protein WAF17_02550 [Bernardetia sp. ABR2-2B]|uniref:hypothetical protein n=1 Tax=Bernardetia sp. ABR2-2B TaxID=3127472 RepID=UPI0030D2AE66